MHEGCCICPTRLYCLANPAKQLLPWSQAAMTFRELLAHDPDHVVDHLAERGTRLLGTFITEVRPRRQQKHFAVVETHIVESCRQRRPASASLAERLMESGANTAGELRHGGDAPPPAMILLPCSSGAPQPMQRRPACAGLAEQLTESGSDAARRTVSFPFTGQVSVGGC